MSSVTVTDRWPNVGEQSGEWIPAESCDGIEQILNRLESLLYQEGYPVEQVELVYWAVHEQLDAPTAQISYRVDDHQTLVRIESATPAGPVLHFGVLPRGGDMEWYCYDEQDQLLRLRDYRVVY